MRRRGTSEWVELGIWARIILCLVGFILFFIGFILPGLLVKIILTAVGVVLLFTGLDGVGRAVSGMNSSKGQLNGEERNDGLSENDPWSSIGKGQR